MFYRNLVSKGILAYRRLQPWPDRIARPALQVLSSYADDTLPDLALFISTSELPAGEAERQRVAREVHREFDAIVRAFINEHCPRHLNQAPRTEVVVLASVPGVVAVKAEGASHVAAN